MKKWLILLISSLLLGGWVVRKPFIKINGVKVVVVEVMDTNEKRQQGLSGRERLGENEVTLPTPSLTARTP